MEHSCAYVYEEGQARRTRVHSLTDTGDSTMSDDGDGKIHRTLATPRAPYKYKMQALFTVKTWLFWLLAFVVFER